MSHNSKYYCKKITKNDSKGLTKISDAFKIGIATKSCTVADTDTVPSRSTSPEQSEPAVILEPTPSAALPLLPDKAEKRKRDSDSELKTADKRKFRAN